MIDGSNIKQYSFTGKKDAFESVVDNGTSFRHLMGLCHDFNKEGMLQHNAKCLGVEVLLTPKCHAELAGEKIQIYFMFCRGAYG